MPALAATCAMPAPICPAPTTRTRWITRPPTSITIASPCPPPEQIAARPRPPPRRRSSYISVPTSRAPDAPTGWPSATAPPLTLTRSAVDAEIARRLQGDRGERLVDLDHVHVRRGQAGALERDLRGARRHARERVVAVGRAAGREDARERLEIALVRQRRVRDDEHRGAVVDAGRVAGRVRRVRVVERRQRGQALERGVASRRLVGVDERRARRARGTSTATISSAMRPESIAATARWCERSAHSSSSPRVEPQLVGHGGSPARTSACRSRGRAGRRSGWRRAARRRRSDSPCARAWSR